MLYAPQPFVYARYMRIYSRAPSYAHLEKRFDKCFSAASQRPLFMNAYSPHRWQSNRSQSLLREHIGLKGKKIQTRTFEEHFGGTVAPHICAQTMARQAMLCLNNGQNRSPLPAHHVL